ncbi:DUF2515 family protein [Priestia megaterium]|uniref:DUF2515 family protein n=1 Tax=Priestia megaterium TaxID=1404 RepID=UPI00196A8DE1|nr:DUF2515 family protein [Priestia megaterium]QSF37992.1 DUF2515 family protein [Priestia megaterium]
MTSTNTNPLIRLEDVLRLQQMMQLKPPATLPLSFIGEDVKLIKEIRKKVKKANQNNVTRTQAYLDYYQKHPEIHWAFLAHLVSRNGGYYMTDLSTTLIKSLLSPEKQHAYFLFLEHSNSAIFHDAYAQLLLYEKSKEQNSNLFHLLPAFHISSFMKAVWDDFWQHRNKTLLSMALIVNEQYHIEKNVLFKKEFQRDVLHSWQFHTQNFLGMTQIVFPYYSGNNIDLCGTKVYHFESVLKRIEVGKTLYVLLFYSNLHDSIYTFSLKHSHTGSRSDYNSDIFTKNRTDSKKLYSPTLTMSWGDRIHLFLRKDEWFEDEITFSLLESIPASSVKKIPLQHHIKVQSAIKAANPFS